MPDDDKYHRLAAALRELEGRLLDGIELTFHIGDTTVSSPNLDHALGLLDIATELCERNGSTWVESLTEVLNEPDITEWPSRPMEVADMDPSFAEAHPGRAVLAKTVLLYGRYDPIWMTELMDDLHPLEDDFGPSAEQVIDGLKQEGHVGVEMREGEPHDYSVLSLNEDSAWVQWARDVTGVALPENTTSNGTPPEASLEDRRSLERDQARGARPQRYSGP